MTQPGLRHVPCACGHNKLSHDVEMAPRCAYQGCGCATYRPATAPALASVRPEREGLIAAGRASTNKRTRALADKLATVATELRDRLDAERAAVEEKRRVDVEREAARSEVERLKRELAAAQARAAGRTPPRSTETPLALRTGDYPCPHADCNRAFGMKQGLAVHLGRAHAAQAS